MDDIAIDRLSKPVDHSALKKKFEREQKREFQRAKSALKTSQSFMRNSRSRSGGKRSRRKYKSFLNQLGRATSTPGNKDYDSDGLSGGSERW